MEILRVADEMRRWSRGRRASGRILGLVPTMGSLHRGHLSLVDECRRRCDHTVVSLYVNPTQFGAGEDFERYPRDEERDLELLSREGVDCVFAPDDHEIYPPGDCTFVEVRGPLTEALCGARRPGHFAGVVRVVTRLFTIVEPDLAVFGSKDYQQLLVVRRLALDLRLGVEIVAAPTVREDDGLALSSRNTYLSGEERRQAPALYAALRAIEKARRDGERNVARLAELGRRYLTAEAPLARLDYLELRHPETLDELETIGAAGAVVAVAAFFSSTRLIDNLTLDGFDPA